MDAGISIARRSMFWLLVALLSGLWVAASPPLDHLGLDGGSYLRAASRVAQGLSPYEKGGGYIYPPALAQLLSFLPEPATRIWNVLLMISALLTIALGLSMAGFKQRAWAALAFLLLFAQPVVWGLHLGNASLLIAGLLALALALLESLPVIAGVLIGLATLIKVTPVLLAVWLGAGALRHRERWRIHATASCAAVLLLGAASADHLEFVRLKSTEIEQRAALGSNFSISAELHRGFGWSPPGALVLALGLICALVIGLRSPPSAAGVRSSAGIVQLLAIVSTPVAWSHLYVLALWPALIAAGALYARPDRGTHAWRLEAMVLAIAFLIVARTALWYLPDNAVGRVVLPLGPLLALVIIAAMLARSQVRAAAQSAGS